MTNVMASVDDFLKYLIEAIDWAVRIRLIASFYVIAK